MSSIRTMSTLGALAGALTSNRGGGVALRTSSTVLCGYWGSGIGSTVRSVGSTTLAGAACWAATGAAVSEASINDKAKPTAKVIDVRVMAVFAPISVPACSRFTDFLMLGRVTVNTA